jgi:26S proteasome regulatory subunit N1
MGMIGAGTNNSRIAGMLRQLGAFYAKEPNHLFLVRIAQGLLHLGKGLMTLSPFSSDGLLLSKVSMAGLLIVFHCALDAKNTILSSRHYLLYGILSAIRPRMLITLDEEGNSIPVSVRVGQAVDISGQAGKPKAITGFQTHTTPVLLSANDRAELATDEYIALPSVLEGFVIVKVNPESKDRKAKEAKDLKDKKNKK